MKSQLFKSSTKSLLSALILASVASGATAQMLKPEEAIKTRKAAYNVMAWNMGKIKVQTVEAPQAYKKEEVLKAAQIIAALSTSGMGALYLPGTDKEVNGEKTRVKPELFTDKEGAAKVSKDFAAEAAKLAEVAATGDVNAIKAQFGKTGETCKACHEKFRKE